VPGVTRVLADCGYVKGADWFTDESRIRGKQAHYACQLVDQHAPDALTMEDALDVIDLAPALHPYLAGYLLFRREKSFRPVWNERPMHLSSPMVAGTPDSWGHYGDGRKVLVDLKSWRGQGPTPKRAAVLQTAGYKLMVKEATGEDTDLRVIVALPGDGRYRAYECKDPRDEFLFQCCAHSWWDRYNNKLVSGDPAEVEVEA
jgi:hypothetical protein